MLVFNMGFELLLDANPGTRWDLELYMPMLLPWHYTSDII